MSYYFAIIGTKDNPLFEHEFGTYKGGGDGAARFRAEARHLNQFVAHASLDVVEETQWSTGQMYLKHIDRFHGNYVSCFLTPSNAKFLLLFNPDAHHLQHRLAGSALTAGGGAGGPIAPLSAAVAGPAGAGSMSSVSSVSSAAAGSGSVSVSAAAAAAAAAASSSSTASSASAAAAAGFNPTAAVTEEAQRAFFADVFDAWVKTVLSPFYALDAPVRSPVFRARVAAAAKKFL